MNEQMVKNDPISAMKEENIKTNLFDGVSLLMDDDIEKMVAYHEKCDQDLFVLEDDNEFSDVLDKILEHLGECVVEDDDEEEFDFDDEDEEE